MQAQLGRNSHPRLLAGRKMALCACRRFLFHWHQACRTTFQTVPNARINHRYSLKKKQNRCGVGFIWQFNAGKEMHGHVPTLKWIMAVWGYCHSSYLKHLLCCKKNKKIKGCRSIFNERVSIQRFSHFTGSPGRLWLMRCAEKSNDYQAEWEASF